MRFRTPIHGHARKGKKSKTYSVWVMMRQRCFNKKGSSYPYYGGRGIGIHPTWGSYETFLRDMGEAPKGLTLDRIDVNADYGPKNCRWTSRLEQARNRNPRGYIKKDKPRKKI